MISRSLRRPLLQKLDALICEHVCRLERRVGRLSAEPNRHWDAARVEKFIDGLERFPHFTQMPGADST
jgi:hypothetical protein